MPNGVRVALYFVGLAAIMYIAFFFTGDRLFSTAVAVFAHWVKPFQI